MAAFIASQRDAHGVPHAVSCRALGVSQSWFYKWKDGELPPRAARRERLKAEIARLFAAARGQGRVAADHRRAAGCGLAGQREHRRGPDARAGPGRPAQEAPQGDDPAGQGPVAGTGPGEAEVRRRRASTAAGTATAPRSSPGRASSTWTRCWTWARAGSSGSRSAPITTRRWPTARWRWRWPSGAAPCPAWCSTPIRAASTPRAASGPRASGSGIAQSMGRPGSALDNAVIESWHSTLEFELRSLRQFATRDAGAGRGRRVDRGLQPRPPAFGARHDVPGGLRAVAAGKGRRVTAAGPLRGPGKGGGCAAAVLLAPAKGTGPPLRPQGCCASPWRATALRAALDPGDHCGPSGQEKRAGHRPAPPGKAGARRPARAGHDHHNRSLHG